MEKTEADAKAALETLGLDIDVNRPLGSYSVAIQQLVAIARAVALDAKMLILDEPTASLDGEEIQTLFRIMRELRDKGWGLSSLPTSLIRFMRSQTGLQYCATGDWSEPL